MPKHYRFEALVNALMPDLFRYAFWLSRNREVAEDLVQETLFRAWRSLDALRDEDSAKSWLITILRRENARLYERKRLETVDIDALGPADAGRLAHREQREVSELREAMFALEDQYREPLVLQVLMGHSTDEIAGIMGISTGAVLTRLFRARKRLQEQMLAEGGARRGAKQ